MSKVEVDKNSVFISGIEYVPKSESKEVAKIQGDYVIVRCRNAGVHAGYLEYRKDGVVRLKNSRRLWRWWSKFSLSGLADCGVLESKISEVRFSCVLAKLDLTDSDVCEVLYCTEKAMKSIQSIKDHENE